MPPVPVLGIASTFSDLRDILFVKDGQEHELIVRNDAAAQARPDCARPGDTPLAVDVTIDGPASAFLEGLPGNSFRYVLEPGEKLAIPLQAKPLAGMLKTAKEDVLYGVKVTIDLSCNRASHMPADLRRIWPVGRSFRETAALRRGRTSTARNGVSAARRSRSLGLNGRTD